MSWIKEANKIGSYQYSSRGFRIYCTKEPTQEERIIERDGEQWRETRLIKGEFVAIDKFGVMFKAGYIDELGYKIDVEIISRKYKN